MKNKIAQRLTAYFALMLVLFALVAGTLFSLMFARHTADVTQRDLRAHAVSIAETISKFVCDCEQEKCKGGGFRAYMRYIGDAAMSKLYLLDAQGKSVVLGEMELPEEALPPRAMELVDDVFASGSVMGGDFSLNPFFREEMLVCAPVFDAQGTVQYALVMRMPVSGIAHALQDAFYMLSACLVIAMVIAMAASGFLSRRFVNPLYRMMDAATQMAGGDYSVKTHVVQQDEIGVLAAQIDALAERLDEAEKERSSFEKMRQEFLSDISHELRTPVSVLKGNLELLRSGIVGDEAQRKQSYDQLYADTEHLQRLIQDLLELTRLQNTQFRIGMETINLMDVMRDSVRFMRQKAAEKKIDIRMQEAAPFAVQGDYGRLRQLMIILLDNAIKFSREGETVEIDVRAEDGVCEVSIIDHGCGIEEEALRHIFDRYFHSQSGTGLGLPIAREIAQRHDIQISCRSTLGEGTRFVLVFAGNSIWTE